MLAYFNGAPKPAVVFIRFFFYVLASDTVKQAGLSSTDLFDLDPLRAFTQG